MGWPWKKKTQQPQQPQEIRIINVPEIQIKHTIEKKPDPRPVRGWFTFSAMDGTQTHSDAFYINGRSGMVVNVPRRYVTGDWNDHGVFRIALNLEY